MRLVSIELQGFKSFPDKTRLEFDDGITAVVGPNGSGKSNIVDAMRWVLGEQSTKTLRGSRMEDVIFSGTQARKAVGYASVELTIDNSNNELKDYDETVCIGRRLYRSGESEYRINGDIVRMRDVHELFMDTGLGRDGYSIIGQGKIAEIVSARSNDRREIFEEAAGIAKFRYRRTDAQRQLDNAQENLLRLNDILAELEDRVEPLRIQSEKAKKYLELAGERKDLEISLWVYSLEELKQKLAQQENKVLISRNDYEKLESQSANLETTLASIFEQMQQLVVAADERRQNIKNLENESSENNSQIAVLKNDIQHNLSSAEKLEKDILGADEGEENLKAQLQEKNTLLKEYAEKLESIRSSIRENLEALQQQRLDEENLKAELDGYTASRDSLRSAVSEIKLEQAASQSLFSESTSQLEVLKTRGNEHDKAVSETKSSLDECATQIDEQKGKINGLKNSLNGYEMKKSSRMENYKTMESERDKLANQKEQKVNRASLLKDMEANMEGYAGSVRYILKQSKQGKISGVYGAVSSLISTNSQHITAIETALGGAMQYIVVDDENAAKQGIAMLREARVGRATFLPLTSVKGRPMDFSHLEKHVGFVGAASQLVGYQTEFQGVINQLLGRICVVDDLNTGTIIAKESGYRFRIVTLDGQVINAGGSYTGGTTSRSAGVLGRRNEIQQLNKDAKFLQKQIAELEPSLKDYGKEMALVDAEITALNAEIQNSSEELVRLELSYAQLEKNLASAKYNRDLAKEELNKLSKRLKDLEEGKSTSSQLIEENNLTLKKLEEDIERCTNRYNAAERKSRELSERQSEIRLEELEAHNNHENLLAETTRLSQQLENADSLTKELVKEKEILENKNQLINQQISELKVRQEHLSKEVDIHNTRIKEFMEKRNNLEKSTTDMRKQEREISTKREDISRELARLEERQHTLQQDYDNIIARMWDEYQLTRSNAVVVAKKLDDIDASKKRLAELKGSIRKLGSVNLAAVEEYKEVSERYEFLSEQMEDVEQSRAKLIKLIDELTDEMQTLFTESFREIQKEFTITFSELFGGGHGELRLSDEEDVLESGIEINVQPPGKVIKNLSLLSGGEQAFVAIAIYFSILKVKPAPFVLLDEIEAALDDVNVIKFAQYLRRLSDNMQFIAITHRRGTMEEADVLYGVTMQEEGVSKLLELNVHEVESKLGMEAQD